MTVETLLYDLVRRAVRAEIEAYPDTKCFSYEQVADQLGVKKRTVEQWARDGRLEVRYLGPQLPRVRARSLHEFLNACPDESPARRNHQPKEG